MSDCRRHILASHICPAHILGGDRLELVLDYTGNKARPLTIASSGIVWGQFSELEEAKNVFYDILLGRKDPLGVSKHCAKSDEKTVVTRLRLVERDMRLDKIAPAPRPCLAPETARA